MARVVLRGRPEAMASALSVLRQVSREGHGGVVLITGEPGIGKTALLAAVLAEARSRRFACGGARADYVGLVSPAAPLLLAVRSGAQPLLGLQAIRELCELTSQPLLFLDRIADYLAELAAARPIAIAIDDSQWADALSRFTLRSLPARLAASPVVWVIAGRCTADGLIDDLTHSRPGEVSVTALALEPLAATDVVAIAQDHLGRVPGEDIRRMLDSVDGNPLLAAQILEGIVRAEARGEALEQIPVELVLGVRRRLEQLNPVTSDLVRACSVFNQPFTVDGAAATIGDQPRERVTCGVEDAIRANFLAADHGLLVFRHGLVRESIYRDLSEPDRRRMHLRCAQYLRSVGHDPLVVATHAEAGLVGGDELGAGLVASAATQIAASLPDRAADLMLAAFRAIRTSQPSWFDLGERCIEVLGLAQRCNDAVAVADLLLAHTDDDDQVARVEVAVARPLWLMGQLDAAVTRSRSALSRASASPPLRARLEALHVLASARIEPADSVATSAHAALGLAKEVDDRGARILATHALAEIARNSGRHRISLQHFRQLRAADEPTFIAQEIMALQHLDRYADAETMLRAAWGRTGSDTASILPSLIYAQIWQAINLTRLDEAEAAAWTLMTLAAEIGSRTCGLESAAVLSAIAITRGDLCEARARLSLGGGPADEADERHVPALRLFRACLTGAEGDAAAAVALLAPLMFGAREGRDSWAWKPGWMRALAQIGLAAGDSAFVAEAIAVAEMGAARNAGVASFEGLALQVRGLAERDASLLERASLVLSRGPRPLLYAAALDDAGTQLLNAGHRTEAVIFLDRAWDSYYRIGASGPMAAVQRRMRAAGFHRAKWPTVDPSVRLGASALTDTEARVARLVSSGHTNKSAAKELGISPNTIGTHLRSIFAKLDVRSRVQLSNRLHQLDAFEPAIGKAVPAASSADRFDPLHLERAVG